MRPHAWDSRSVTDNPHSCSEFLATQTVTTTGTLRLPRDNIHTHLEASLTLSAKDDINTRLQQLKLGGGQFSDTFGEERLIERNNL
jgi:hypothetical protein